MSLIEYSYTHPGRVDDAAGVAETLFVFGCREVAESFWRAAAVRISSSGAGRDYVDAWTHWGAGMAFLVDESGGVQEVSEDQSPVDLGWGSVTA